MIEERVLNYLNDALSVPCSMEMPDNVSGRFVVIEKTGSYQQNKITQATFAIQSYADTLHKAALLNEEVKAAMEDMIQRDDISKIQLNSDYNYTDTAMKYYRYQAVFIVTYY